ncbi:hypothetical protein AB0D97_31235, partial [Streptomyces roseus]|uniref:hypothetical protein n=1 Tax=Streptomyces roseus TaxID=66430 RepID=UPI0033CF0C87
MITHVWDRSAGRRASVPQVTLRPAAVQPSREETNSREGGRWSGPAAAPAYGLNPAPAHATGQAAVSETVVAVC